MVNEQGPGVRRARRDRKFGVLSRLSVMAAVVVGMFGLILPALPAAASCSSCTIWNPATQPTGQSVFFEPRGVELGLTFTTDVPGFVTALRFYKDPSMSAPPSGPLWTPAGPSLARATYPEPPPDWQQVA